MKELLKTYAFGAITTVAALTSTANAETFRYAYQGSVAALDPYTLNETFTLGFLGNVYEGLVARDADLRIVPALAERWEQVEPTRWRFYLRKGVTFHDGSSFDADDVIFSAERVRMEGSDLRNRIPATAVFEKVDDYTVDVVLGSPNPILISEWDTWYIMDSGWSEANGATAPTSVAGDNENFAAFNANGTGPFRILTHMAGVRTELAPFDGWWDRADHNLTEVIFEPVAADATRVAGLLSGEYDMVFPVPLQDIDRVRENNTTDVLTGPELRTIFLGFDQMRDELLFSDVEGANPFQDIRVRQAVYHAIDIEAIRTRVMRELSTPSALLISPFQFSRSDNFERLDYDPDRARALLSEAGYHNGFTVTLDCPNDRYVNDERICQAVASMLGRVGINIDLNAQPKAQYFAQVLASGGYNTSFYLLGWTPGSFDSWNVLHNLNGCRDETGSGGPFNLGGYCNPDVDALTTEILIETDLETRDDLIEQAYRILTNDVSYVPLHQQALSWGVRRGVEVAQRADNQLLYRWINISRP